ncbi:MULTISPECIES: class I SAM-dependent methyltransferase [unclassified Variovorax]|uniref:class I SAM-dependent methyltransferase n=1 Tax=unclassified Variovorax TaxID=663243 RepID=UPI003ECFB2C3
MTKLGDDPNLELDSVRERYDRRAAHDLRYSLLNPAALHMHQERQRAMVRLFARIGMTELHRIDLVEVGSGDGGNLLELLRMGCAPDRLSGIELLPERHAAARARLPAAVRLSSGDAAVASIEPASCDVVFVSTVFSSLLDDAFQQRLADAMWRWVKPGGGVLWYDFTVDNPRNADVRGVPLKRVRALFPQGQVHVQRITLAPPIARRVTAVHPSLYTLFNTIPLLRTHVLAWIAKS